ncbi:MAG: extracellular solute-binding protein [Geminicoccaceae bacterium]
MAGTALEAAASDKKDKTMGSGGTLRHSRRQLLQEMAAAGVGLAVMPVLPAGASTDEQAIYFTWGGYDDENMQVKYTEQFGEPPVRVTYGDAEEGLQKLRAGFVADVMHPCSGDLPRWRDAGVLQPIDTSRLKNWPDLFPNLRELPVSLAEGKTWMAPWEWGQTSITYRTDLVELPNGEETWGILWDTKNEGKISVIDSAEDTWWVAAIYGGVPFDKIDDAAMTKVADLLKQQRPLVRMYSSDNTQQEQALASGEVVAAMTWADAATSLIKQGLPVKFARPKEGTLTWVCGMVLHKDAPHLERAYTLIDGMLSPEVGRYCIETWGYGHSNPKSFEGVDPAVLAAVGITGDPQSVLDTGHFYVPQPPDIATRINRDWEQIKAGF